MKYARDIVVVTWEDVASQAGWQRAGDTMETGVTVRSVGWLAKETDNAINLSLSNDESDKVNDTITILKVNVRKVDIIRKGKEK